MQSEQPREQSDRGCEPYKTLYNYARGVAKSNSHIGLWVVEVW